MSAPGEVVFAAAGDIGPDGALRPPASAQAPAAPPPMIAAPADESTTTPPAVDGA